jgi:hypothetical protein
MTQTEQLPVAGTFWGDLAANVYLGLAVAFMLATVWQVGEFLYDRWGPAQLDNLQMMVGDGGSVDKLCPRVTNMGTLAEVNDFDVPVWSREFDAIKCFSNEAGLQGEGWDGDLHFTPHAIKGRMTSLEALTKMLEGTPAAVYKPKPSDRSIEIVARSELARLEAEDAAEEQAAAIESKPRRLPEPGVNN